MTIVFDVADGVATIRLDRPDVLNAFNDEMGDAVLEAMQKASSDEGVRCIVLTGAGRAFSSGEDLAALVDGYKSGDVPNLGQTLVNRYNPLIRTIRSAPKPVLAAINGVAAGAGASIALACDFRIATSKAKLILAFIKVGLVPDSGGVWFLSRMVGAATAWRLAATGDPVDAAQALELGLVDRVVEPDDFENAWREWAAELAAGPTRAYALTKELVNSSTEVGLHDQLDREVRAQTEAGLSADHLEGVRAFLDKRPPHFEGR